MRKIISLGLFALLVSGFSANVLAGDPSECTELKGDKDNPGLYGLCIAWHNADANGNEQAKEAIAEQYFRKSGGDDVPGSGNGGGTGTYDFVCPCWNEETVETILARGGPASAPIFEDPNFPGVYSGLVAFTSLDSDGETTLIEQFIAFPSMCTHSLPGGFPVISAPSLLIPSYTTADYQNCGFELSCIANLHETEDCADP